MSIATNRRVAQEKKFTRQGFSVAEVHHRPGRESPFTNNSETKPQRPLLENASAASDGGSYNEMMLIRAAPQRVALPKTIERGKSVGRDSVEPQVVDRSQLPRDASSARPPIFHRQHADATLT
jgi:hypothetical protein